jgi:4-amino-4-deoxy-L-arabinose transferase-like glycosyltransferase
MSAASPRVRWGAAVALLLLGALALRLWGLRTGLPYVYNADENAHFVPRAIGMFGHTYNPGYFVNPPGFTYLLHVLFAVRWGGDGVQDAYAADLGDVFELARAGAAVLGTIAVGLLYLAGVRLLGDRRMALLAAALIAVSFLPVFYAHFALNDVPALAPLCLALVGIGGVWRDGRGRDFALAGLGIGLACATKYTAGIVVLCLLAAVAAGGR